MGSEQSGPATGAVRLRDPLPADAPSPSELEQWFRVTEIRVEGDRCYYFGHALVNTQRLTSEVWPVFDDAGYEVAHHEEAGEDVLVARPSSVGLDGVPWTQLVLFGMTVVSTLFAGSLWFHADPMSDPSEIVRGWPFAVAVLTVLGTHELGHYVTTRYHGVEATLPYFIPIPTLIGTMGAVIKMRGRMPNRRALFDIGVSGPLAGLVAAVVVTVIGLHLDPVEVPGAYADQEGVYEIRIFFPILIEQLAELTGQPLYYEDPAKSVNPVVVAGWVGMLVTFLNLIPVGQLDGGHVVRSLLPEHQRVVAAAVPGLLFALAGYLYAVEGVAAHNLSIWVLWGGVSLLLVRVGPATPIDDDTELGAGRRLVGVVTFLLGLACFMPVPIAISL